MHAMISNMLGGFDKIFGSTNPAASPTVQKTLDDVLEADPLSDEAARNCTAAYVDFTFDPSEICVREQSSWTSSCDGMFETKWLVLQLPDGTFGPACLVSARGGEPIVRQGEIVTSIDDAVRIASNLACEEHCEPAARS